MKTKKVMIAMLAIMAVATSCKNDSEDDIFPPEQSKTTGLYINEVYTSNPDWIELYNGNDATVDLSGFILQDEKGADEEYKIPGGTKIAAKSCLVIDAFPFGLSSSNGDKVILLDAQRNAVNEVKVPPMDDGQSYGRETNGAGTWKVFSQPTKGIDNTTQAVISYTGKIVINEVYTFSGQESIDDLDFIELFNTTEQPINVGGLKLWESGGREEAWSIPAGKTIAAKGRLLIESDKEGFYADPVNYPSWGLSKGPDEYVVLGDALMNRVDSVKLPSMNINESYGRMSDGAENWQVFRQYTKGTPNAGEARPDNTNKAGIFINEVYHDNQDAPLNGQAWTMTDFIELYNANETGVDISGWEIYDDKGDEGYVIPAGTMIPAKGFLTFDVFKGNTAGPVFGLGVGGDWVFLYKSGKNELVDSVEIPGFSKDSGLRGHGYTCGRLPDGGSETVIFTEASRNASNNGKAVLK